MKKLFIFITVLCLSLNLEAMGPRNKGVFDWSTIHGTTAEPSSPSSSQPSAEAAPSFGGMTRAYQIDWASFHRQAAEPASSLMIDSEQMPASMLFVPGNLPVTESRGEEQSALHTMILRDSDGSSEEERDRLPSFGGESTLSSQPSSSSSSQHIMPSLDDLEIVMPYPVLSGFRLRTSSTGNKSILSRSPNPSRSPSPLLFSRTATPFAPGSSSPSSLSSGKNSPEGAEVVNLTLHEAVFCNNNELVALFIKEDTDLNELDALTGKTPLHVAVEADNACAISMLLAAGANANIMDKNGYSVVCLAEVHGNPEIIALLPKLAIKVSSTSSKQRSKKSSKKHSKKRSSKKKS
ncbi:ankyrin repeat domain-containing protein [Candidatus Babeliales bacterium]|nr:ankyrin repeat domain-containing protein [Candidatus Babeliales bacterium]